jgi:hypothetical protein
MQIPPSHHVITRKVVKIMAAEKMNVICGGKKYLLG